jgi:hypothetical protein
MIHISYVLNGMLHDHLRFRSKKIALKWMDILRERDATNFKVVIK